MIVIDELKLADVGVCSTLEQELFIYDSPWSASVFRSELKASYNRYFAARKGFGEPPIGYSGISILGAVDSYECEIRTIAVAVPHQGKGIGRGLLDAMLEVADLRGAPVFLEVRVDNYPAIGLYESVGFIRSGIRKRYYQPSGTDAYTMTRLMSVRGYAGESYE